MKGWQPVPCPGHCPHYCPGSAPLWRRCPNTAPSTVQAQQDGDPALRPQSMPGSWLSAHGATRSLHAIGGRGRRREGSAGEDSVRANSSNDKVPSAALALPAASPALAVNGCACRLLWVCTQHGYTTAPSSD